jgi:hypothetical protein
MDATTRTIQGRSRRMNKNTEQLPSVISAQTDPCNGCGYLGESCVGEGCGKLTEQKDGEDNG